MISFEDALVAVLAEARFLESERVPLGDALGRYLVVDLVSGVDSPRFDNSAMDGFAVIASDLTGATVDAPVSLQVVATVYAGDPVEGLCLESGQCARIMTGAAVMPGADAIVMQEDVALGPNPSTRTFSSPAKPGQAVRKRGEEYVVGEFLVGKGAVCSPAVLALVASQGLAEVDVGRTPQIGIIVTGSELAKPGASLGLSQIYESNSVALSAAAKALTGRDAVVKSVGDDASATREVFESLVGECDVVVFSGGASVGEKDLVRSTLLESGVTEKFWRISMKPGKPVFFGVHTGGALVFALPGNPVSAQVTFELFVASAVLKMSGSGSPQPRIESAVLGQRIQRVSGRKEFVRAATRIDGGRLFADPLGRQGSHMSSGIALADRLVVVDSEVGCVEEGSIVETVPLRWSVQ